MKVTKKAGVATVLACAVFAGAVVGSCGKKQADPYAGVDKNYLNGIDEPLAGADVQVVGFDLDVTVDLIRMLGCKTVRFRIPKSFLSSPEQYDVQMYEYLKDAEKKLNDAGISLIGQAMLFPAYTDFRPDSANSAPTPSDPAYGEWLQAVSDMWSTLTSLFPDVGYWEMGNEFNAATFFHPNGYIPSEGSLMDGIGGFDAESQIEVVTDYMFYATKGIHAGSKKAKSVMPGLSPMNGSLVTVKNFVADVYDRIESGNAPYGEWKSTEADDYFEVLCWHPYASRVDESWLSANDAIYRVAIDHGDEGKKVFFTEFGFSDGGYDDKEEVQIGYMETAYRYCLEKMPYVERLCAFRLYECAYAEVWGGINEVHFGYFREPDTVNGFSPKEKAFALQKLYGGEGDLTKYQ